MKKRDVFSILVDSTKNKILRRLDQAEKAAYSDLLDSVEGIRHLTSTGTFNYHLNFLLENSLIVKDGLVYKLTKRGRDIVNFVKDIDQMWKKLEPKIRGERMSIFSCAEQFEEETGIKNKKKASKFHGIDLITDARKVIGLIDQEDCEKDFFRNYEPVQVEDLKLCLKECGKETREKEPMGKKELALSHPDLKYHLSPELLGAVHRYLQSNFGEAHIYALEGKTRSILVESQRNRHTLRWLRNHSCSNRFPNLTS